jgi:hypothetical protein
VRRDLTHAEVLSSWRINGETRGHTVQETIGFVNELQDVADAEAQRRASPVFLAGACEPWWLTRLRARFGR